MPCDGSVFKFPVNTGGIVAMSGSGLGAGKVSEGDEYFESASTMKSCHIGATMKDAGFFTIDELSLLPVHAPIAILGEYPMIHASRKSLVVPVLTATS